MFKNVGGEIKRWATVLAVAYVFGYGFIGMMAGLLLKDMNAVIVLAVVAGVVGYLVGKFKVMLLYAYGEITEDLKRIREAKEQPEYK